MSESPEHEISLEVSPRDLFISTGVHHSAVSANGLEQDMPMPTHKQNTQTQIQELKSRLRLLKERNLELPFAIRFTDDEFLIDERPSAGKRAANEEKLVNYYRAQEFTAAKQFVQMQKIQDFFLNIESHYLVLSDLEHQNQVSTFRIRAPNDEYWKGMERNRKLIEEEESTGTEVSVETVPETVELTKRYYAKDMIGEFEGKKYDIGTMHAIQHLEKRLAKRYEKECQWAALYAERIPDDWVPAEDVAALQYAEEIMGDFKLKLDPDFVDENITVSRVRQQILDLKLEMYEKRHQFNQLVYQLKDEKSGLLDECRQLIGGLVKLQEHLPQKLRQPIPKLYDLERSEQPEKLFDITEEDVDKKIKEKAVEFGFQEEMEAMETKLFSSPVHSGEMSILQPTPPQKPAGTETESFDGLQPSVDHSQDLFYEGKNETDGAFQHDTIISERMLQQNALFDKLCQKINYYKNRVLTLVGEKIHLETGLKMIQITITNSMEELDICKHFNHEEHTIREKLEKGMVELEASKEKRLKAKMMMNKTQENVQKTSKEMELNQMHANSEIGDNHRFVEYLKKLFRACIEPSLPHHGSSDANSHAITDESYSSTTTVRASRFGDSHVDRVSPGSVMFQPRTSKQSKVRESTATTTILYNRKLSKPPKPTFDFVNCPDGLDKQKFEKVHELGAKQRQLSVELESKKRIANHAIQYFQGVEKAREQKLSKLERLANDIHTLHRRKQERINNIDKIVLAKAHQIQCLDDAKLEEMDYSKLEDTILYAFHHPKNILAISSGVTDHLDSRAEELKIETKSEQDKLRTALTRLRRVKEGLKKKEKAIFELKESCNDHMQKKFGRPVDLDQLSAAAINLHILDAQAELELHRNDQLYEHHLVKKEITQAKSTLIGVTKLNSELNTLVAILEERQRDIEYYMHLQGKDEQEVQKQLKDQPSYELSESREIRMKNEDMYDELDRLDETIWTQEMRIGVLGSIITACKTKYGVPPLIPLQTISKDRDIGARFATYQEIEQFREFKDKNVVTLYMKDNIMEQLEKSDSEIPFHHQQPKHQSHGSNVKVEQNENVSLIDTGLDLGLSQEFGLDMDEGEAIDTWPEVSSRQEVREKQEDKGEGETAHAYNADYMFENEDETYESTSPPNEQDETEEEEI